MILSRKEEATTHDPKEDSTKEEEVEALQEEEGQEIPTISTPFEGIVDSAERIEEVVRM